MKEDKQQNILYQYQIVIAAFPIFHTCLEQKWDKCVQMYHNLDYVNGTCNKEQKQFKSSTHAKKKSPAHLAVKTYHSMTYSLQEVKMSSQSFL